MSLASVWNNRLCALWCCSCARSNIYTTSSRAQVSFTIQEGTQNPCSLVIPACESHLTHKYAPFYHIDTLGQSCLFLSLFLNPNNAQFLPVQKRFLPLNLSHLLKTAVLADKWRCLCMVKTGGGKPPDISSFNNSPILYRHAAISTGVVNVVNVKNI